MAAPVGTRLVLVCAKAEATPGTAETLAGTDALRTPEWSTVTPPTETPGEALDRALMNARADYGADHAPIGRYIQHSIPIEIHHPVAHAAAAEESAIYEACGYVETLSGGTTSTYATSGAPSGATDVASVTLGFYEGPTGDGERWIVAGARGSLEFTLPNDGCQRAVFNYMGGFAEPTDQAVLTPTFNAGIPVCGAISRAFTLTDGVTTLDDELVVRSCSWTTPYTAVVRPDMSGGALSAKGFRLPCHLQPGRLVLNMEIEAGDLALIPLATMLSQGPNAALWTLTITWTDHDGVGNYVCTDTLRGLRLVRRTPGAGSPRTETLSFRGSSVSTNAAHSRAFT